MHRDCFAISSDHLTLDPIICCLVVMNCVLLSAPLGSSQDSTACNDSYQTSHKQQGVGSCDGCYHDRWIGEVRLLCSSASYCKEMEQVDGIGVFGVLFTCMIVSRLVKC